MAKRTYLITFKRVGEYRGLRLQYDTNDINELGELMREELKEHVQGLEQATFTFDDEPNENGVHNGQINYGLLGEFMIEKVAG